ncbi:MAG TPA: amidohydrolase family protein [Gammaproteobacteria bacterium]
MLKRRTVLKSAVAATVIAALREPLLAQQSRPFKLFDCHAHFYTNDADRYPFDAHTARYGPERMIAKAMANPMTPDVVFEFWEAAGVERGLGVQYSSTYYTDNRYLLDISARHPDRIIPIVILDATDRATPGTLERMARENGIAGVRFMGGANQQGVFPYLSDAAEGAWELANELGLSITLMPLGRHGGAALRRVKQLAERYANVAVVLDHIGFPRYSTSPETFGFTPDHLALAGTDNIYYKYTTFLIEMLLGDDTPLRDFLAFAAETFGADRMIWGSDIGNSEVDELLFVRHALDSAAGLTLEQQKAIFYDTAKRIFIPGGRSA